MTDIEDLIQIALDSSNAPFLSAENRLLAQGDSAAAVLRTRLHELTDPFEHLIVAMLLQRLEKDEVVPAILDYFEQAGQRAAETIMRVPPEEGVANYLELHFADRAATFLGVYAVKLVETWDDWKILGSLIYLGRLGPRSPVESLIRFASLPLPAGYREVIEESLVAAASPELLLRIRQEMEPKKKTLEVLKNATVRIEQQLKTTKG